MLSSNVNPQLMKGSWSKLYWFWDSLKGINLCRVEIKQSHFPLCWVKSTQITDFLQQASEWGLVRCVKMKDLFLSKQSEMRHCPCQRCSDRAAWPAELIWTVNHGLVRRSKSPEWIIRAYELLMFEMLPHWIKQQANSISDQDSFLCVSVCASYASPAVSVARWAPAPTALKATVTERVCFNMLEVQTALRCSSWFLKYVLSGKHFIFCYIMVGGALAFTFKQTWSKIGMWFEWLDHNLMLRLFRPVFNTDGFNRVAENKKVT